MIFETLEVGIYGANCYIAGSEKTKEAAIIDPGADFNKIDKKLNELGLIPKIIILTHYHGDHIGAVKEFTDKYNLKIYIHKEDAEALNNSNMNLTKTMFGKGVSIKADVELKDGDEIDLGELKFKIIHTPGHTKGGICIKVGNIMMTGDTLFNSSIGRTDLPGGSFEEIITSIKEKIFKYDDDTLIYPGHMSPSTIKREKQFNPFVN
ncbi:MAG TPA: MBL fold metallo-hydrolase [Clostridiales bacterium]|jgi:glyoxylase-like metal-dependent hydrolase (beta-lactamase superfamily II)|nr:MBL fold metallo-hydrolase [Clostridiales bacterium]HBC29625.1 MBL fold metallo-hydrolase [Clostridiales bacterium]HCS11898.1 MBL fold metallo-hydrolase [Clostridiales bacterium]